MNKGEKLSSPVKTATGMALGFIFLYALANSLMNVSVNEVVNGFSLEGTSQGMMSSMFSLGTMLALLGAPFIQGRVGKMVVMLVATALQAATLALCGLSPVFALFCISCAILGGSGGLVDSYANAVLADVHKENSTRYLGYLHGLFGVGSLLAPLLFTPLLGRAGWRVTFFTLAAIMLVGGGILLIFSRHAEKGALEQATQEKVLSLGDLKKYAKNPRNITVLVMCIFATSCQTGLLAWIMRYMALGFDAEALGSTSISLFWICATFTRFTISRIRMAPIRLFVIGAALSTVFLSVGVLSGSAVGMCIAMAVTGLCTGHFMQVLFGEGTRYNAGNTTLVTSVMNVVMGLTRSILPLVIATVSARVSVAASMMIPAVMSVGSCLSGLMLLRLDARNQTTIQEG